MGGVLGGIALVKSFLDGNEGSRIALLAIIVNGGALAIAFFLLSHAKFG